MQDYESGYFQAVRELELATERCAKLERFSEAKATEVIRLQADLDKALSQLDTTEGKLARVEVRLADWITYSEKLEELVAMLRRRIEEDSGLLEQMRKLIKDQQSLIREYSAVARKQKGILEQDNETLDVYTDQGNG